MVQFQLFNEEVKLSFYIFTLLLGGGGCLVALSCLKSFDPNISHTNIFHFHVVCSLHNWCVKALERHLIRSHLLRETHFFCTHCPQCLLYIYICGRQTKVLLPSQNEESKVKSSERVTLLKKITLLRN